MAFTVTRCYRFILTNTNRLEQFKHPFNSTVLQTFSRAPRHQCCSSLLFTSANNGLNSKTTSLVWYSFRKWFQVVRPRFQPRVRYSNEASGGGSGGSAATPMKALSSTGRIKVILREYGSVAVVFHTAMSLFSLGSCYLVVTR